MQQNNLYFIATLFDRLVRFEDLTMDAEGYMRKILNYMGLNMETEVETFLKEHTSETSSKQNWNTFRNTKDISQQWKKSLSEKEIRWVESECLHAMRLWDYQPALEKDISNKIH